MFARLISLIDTNPALGKLLSRISTTLAVYRGLPMLVGTGLVILSLIATLIIIPVIVRVADLDMVWMLMCLPAFLLHIGIITSFIGFMMAEPIGKGYRE